MPSSSLHSHSLSEHYGSDITTSAPVAYPAFPTSIHHIGPTNDDDLQTFGVSPSGEQHSSNSQHTHMDHDGLHLVPNLSHDGTPIGRQILPPSPIQQHHGFPTHSPALSRTAQPHRAPPPQIPNSAPPGHFDMLPPPSSTHGSWQALHEYAQSHASEHGYALSINTTAKNRSRIKLACVCYGAPKNTHKLTPETRVRKNRVSYKTGCKMWIEGKKQEDGTWVLRVGEPTHNHPGRAIEGWAVQRKRTWGVQGGRVGVGGVTAKEEKERMHSIDDSNATKVGDAQRDQNSAPDQSQKASHSHSLESGGLVWKIVEQEMLRKGEPGQGRDRGVGRTVKVLEERLPGIHIFKRDIYNIRAQIKRARRAAGQELGEGLDSENEEDTEWGDQNNDVQHGDDQQRQPPTREQNIPSSVPLNEPENSRSFSQIDPSLIAQCNTALKNIPPPLPPPSPNTQAQRQSRQEEESEVERLRHEVLELRKALAQRTREVEEKTSENESLKVQVDLAHMAIYNDRGGGPH